MPAPTKPGVRVLAEAADLALAEAAESVDLVLKQLKPLKQLTSY